MQKHGRPAVTAVLGPTNTGKTHLAVERMLAHSSGMIGFPLRLLAREVYDRVARMRGPDSVALVTGEERIWPSTARYLLCTAEAMPVQFQAPDDRAGGAIRDVAFVALDEAQLGQDRERGHVFTSRLLHARGREETMILGSGALVPVVRGLVRDVEVTSRPRFSTLTYDGPRKLRRLPPRSAIIAFSAEEVYAIAEALRRLSGGAAVVMGALSPATRNAQVAMFQAGEVDYLVATDAVGMGLNLQVEHVAFASLNKFDGVRHRRLTVAEMAQIAGRAGRHQRDGTFGSVGEESAFSPEEVAAIEDHRFDPLDWLYWRQPDPSMDSVAALIADLEVPPNDPMLRAAPLASDLEVMQQLATDADAMAPIDSPAMVRRFRDVCGLPDFRRVGPEAHRRLVGRLWTDLSRGAGHVDPDWFVTQLGRLDVTEGAVEVLADRIAAVRSFCYVAHRGDWLADAETMAAAARDVEARLSDALHEALTARFVDRRTAVLLRGLGQDASALRVTVAPDGAVSVDGEGIGTLTGFTFAPDLAAGRGDQKMLLAAAEKYLAVELAQRAMRLASGNNSQFSLRTTPGTAPAIIWEGEVVGLLLRGKHVLSPRVMLQSAISALDSHVVAAVQARLSSFVDETIGRWLRPMVTLAGVARDPQTPASVRAVGAAVVAGCAVVARAEVAETLKSLSGDDRHMLRRLGLRVGYLDIFLPAMLKPRPLQWLIALHAAWAGRGCAPYPGEGLFMMRASDDMAAPEIGYRRVGDSWLRIDLIEKLAIAVHAARVAAAEAVAAESGDAAVAVAADAAALVDTAPDGPGAPDAAQRPHRQAFRVDPTLATSFNLPRPDRMALMRLLDFHVVHPERDRDSVDEADLWWRWRSQPRGDGRPGSRRGSRDDAAAGKGGRFGRDAGARNDRRRPKSAKKGGGGGERSGSAGRPGRPPAGYAERSRAASPFAMLSGMFDEGEEGTD